MRHALFVGAIIAVALVAGCNSGSTPRVLHASISGAATMDYYATEKSLTITRRQNGDAIRIHARRPPEGGIPHSATIIIDITQGVQSGPASYGHANGAGTIEINGEQWSSAFTGNFSCDITQLDTGKDQASGTFSFTARRSAGDTQSVRVQDGSFVLINARLVQ